MDTTDFSHGDIRNHFSHTGTGHAEVLGPPPLENPAMAQMGQNLEESRCSCMAKSTCAGWSWPCTHSWALDPYLLFLTYLFTLVICQILSWAMGRLVEEARWRCVLTFPLTHFTQQQVWPTACPHPEALRWRTWSPGQSGWPRCIHRPAHTPSTVSSIWGRVTCRKRNYRAF